MAGIRHLRLCVALRAAGHHLRLLLLPYLSCRQTSGEDRQWSGRYSGYRNRTSWSKRRTGSAAGDWS